MFETLRRLFDNGKIDEANLQVAVTKGFITQEQFAEITEQEAK